MTQVAGTESSLDPEQDFSKLDEEKLRTFQEDHKLSE